MTADRVPTMTIGARDLMARLQQKLPQMLALIERLVNIDSGSYDREGVNRVSAILAGELERIGFAITRHSMPECADQCIAVKRLGAKGKGRLLILGHADTVWPAGSNRPPIRR